jgi:hypothetical protein
MPVYMFIFILGRTIAKRWGPSDRGIIDPPWLEEGLRRRRCIATVHGKDFATWYFSEAHQDGLHLQVYAPDFFDSLLNLIF